MVKNYYMDIYGVPYFPDAESCKKAKLIIHFRKTKLGVWLTDSYMADKAKRKRSY